MSLSLQISQRMPKLNSLHGNVAYRSTFLRPNVCEKKFTSFCQVLKRCTQKNIGSFFLPQGVDAGCCYRRCGAVCLFWSKLWALRTKRLSQSRCHWRTADSCGPKEPCINFRRGPRILQRDGTLRAKCAQYTTRAIWSRPFFAPAGRNQSHAAGALGSMVAGWLYSLRAGFKCVEALGRIIIRGPYPPSNAIIYMHLQL